jgi:NTP pyrophosphatase (non-canonical NTP hydrolase)
MKNKITHSHLVKVLVKPGSQILAEMSPEDAHLTHMTIGVAGEAGELLDAIKKKTIYQKELDRENVIEELGDIEFYLEGIRQQLNITREECLEGNIKKLSTRYENLQYSNKAAVERKDKQ